MLDSAGHSQASRGDEPTGAPKQPVSPGRWRRVRQDLLDAISVARAVVLVFVIPLQAGVWMATWLAASAHSKPLASVATALLGLVLSFAGLIGVLKLEAADRRRDLSGPAIALNDAPDPAGPGETPSASPDSLQGENASTPAAPVDASIRQQSRVLTLCAAAVIVGWAYLLPGCSGNAMLDLPWLAACSPADVADYWTSVASLAWQVTVPVLLIEMLWSAISR